MTATATALDPEQVYNGLKRMIYRLVHQHLRRHGGDFDELLSEAHWCFLEALRTYDPARGAKVITHVYHRIRYGLHDLTRRQSQPGTIIPGAPKSGQRVRMNPTIVPAPPGEGGIGQLLGRLSEDAGTVVRLLLSRDGSPAGRRQWVTDLLCDYGWASQKVLESLAEIREAL